ncbi:MAG: class I SAM-dependent methyltransferase [Sphingomonas sp.]|uniref:class I SAM-dependent methyltransferase n=1 Tax=Sphingomonas sp. TaxID=28214 RepID=UPI0025E00012|nr:class I SAM-dependent methyltransferase [Sphingomonas sp.]MBY0283193.1 class I SAM-dependent methyltransferase [Sphingomonas sp.]
MQDVLEGYAKAATADFIAAYDGLPPERIYEHVIDLFPNRNAKVADIGAGTGRDAAWFAYRGYDVLAVEPVRELRESGQALHAAPNIKWLDDRLPHLGAVPAHGTFDLVTLCAVWQHLTDEGRAIAMPRLATMIAPSGMLIMSLRHGPGATGRRVFPVSSGTTIETARACGLRLIRRQDANSVQAGNQAMGVSWTWLAFEKVG